MIGQLTSECVVRQSVCPIAFDCRLVEAAVWLAVDKRTRGGQPVPDFQRERERLYEIEDPEVREAGFRALGGAWFVRLELHAALEQALVERFDRSAGLDHCLTLPAISRGDEMADLSISSHHAFEQTGQAPMNLGRPRTVLVVRLRPESLLAGDALLGFLRHELLHVADMLDPVFGYERAVAVSDDGPSHENLLRERYRVLWDATIDGRLVREGTADPRVRGLRFAEFTRTFAIPPDRADTAFSRWFDGPRPCHQDLMAFAAAPFSSDGTRPGYNGRCPICRFPVAHLDTRTRPLPAEAIRALERSRPTWHVAEGLCPQCADLYEARYAETS